MKTGVAASLLVSAESHNTSLERDKKTNPLFENNFMRQKKDPWRRLICPYSSVYDSTYWWSSNRFVKVNQSKVQLSLLGAIRRL